MKIEKLRDRCDPITQEAIDASLSFWLVWRGKDIDLGAKVLARRSERGYPWDFDREQLGKAREHRKALRGAKPRPKPKQPLGEPLL
jgi:hypothetical protein